VLQVPLKQLMSVVQVRPVSEQKPLTQVSAQSVLAVQEVPLLLHEPGAQVPPPQVELEVQTLVVQPAIVGWEQIAVRLAHLAGGVDGLSPQQSVSTVQSMRSQCLALESSWKSFFEHTFRMHARPP
jgi:hypothetical protein